MGYRYIGSKARLIDEINGYIDKYSGNGRFIDAFCGMGHVAIAAANKGWPIVINDQMLYAGYISRARLLTDAQVNFEALGGYDRVIAALNSVEGVQGYFWREYSPASLQFCGIERKYFTERNAMIIDAIRLQIKEWYTDELITENEKILLLVNLMEAINEVANIAGTYGCFLSKWTEQSNQLLKMKKSSLRENCGNVELLCTDVKSVDYRENDVVYLDPPYTKRQYASYYHILETIAVEDEPIVEGVSGLRPWKSKASDYCYKNKAQNSMIGLLERIESRKILISYSNDGHIQINDILPLIEEMGNVCVHELKQINRYKSNVETDGRMVKEYLIILEKV